MGLRLITAPTDEPITLEQAKSHLRVAHESDDDYIAGLIEDARAYVEDETQRALITQTLEYTVDWLDAPRAFDGSVLTAPTRPTVIYLPRPPLQSVSYFNYLDADGAEQSFYSTLASPQITSSLVVDNKSDWRQARLVPVNSGTWPALLDQANAVTIRYIAGYGASGEYVPRPLIRAIYLMIAHFYENREPINIGNITTELAFSVQALMAKYKIENVVL
jgi:uncharacterized phiE125 gp8 family phage protein